MYDVSDEYSWYDIPGHPNHQVSLKGQVRHKYKKNILKPHIDKDGYQRLSLGSVNNVPVHRIACEAIYGPPVGDRNQVNHIDCNRQNNFFLNLEWVTAKENIEWGVRKGNIDPLKGSKRASEVNPKPVRIVETGETFPSVKACAEYLGVKPTNVSRCLVGERKGQRLHGCHLEFVDKEGLS